MELPVIFENDFLILFPEIFLVFTICMLLIFGAIFVAPSSSSRESNSFTNKGQTGNQEISSPIIYLCSFTLIMAGFLSFNGTFSSGPLLHGTLFHDNLTATSKGTLFIVAALCLLVSRA